MSSETTRNTIAERWRKPDDTTESHLFRGIQKNQYAVEQTLDLTAFKGLMWVRRYSVHDLTEQFRSFARQHERVRRSVEHIAENLERGIFINNPSLALSNLQPDFNQWKKALFAKLREFSSLWLAARGYDEQHSSMSRERLQALSILYGDQVLLILANRPEGIDNVLIITAEDIAKRLHEIGSMHIYLDGGVSVNNFNAKGDGVVKDIINLMETAIASDPAENTG